MGWTRTEEEDWSLYLALGRPSDDFFRCLGRGQSVNRFAGMGAYAIKGFLNENLRRAREASAMRLGDPQRFSFHPPTFSLPTEVDSWQKARQEHPAWLWLLKPSASSRGRGISFVSDLEDLPTDGDWLVQRYIENPHLIDGFKYGLRYYVLVSSLDPLLIYLHQEGTCRLTTRRYSIAPAALGDPLVHLINTAVQQTQSDTPWWLRNLTLTEYYDRLRSDGVDVERFHTRVRDLLTRTFIACRQQALIESRETTSRPDGCFEFLGVDIQVDEQLNPWLLECNPAPPMEDEGGFDEESGLRFAAVKKALMADTLSLLGFSDPGNEHENGAAGVDWLARYRRELSCSGGWQPLWPGDEAHRFVPDFPVLRPLDRQVASRYCDSVEGESPRFEPSSTVTAFGFGQGLALHHEPTGRIYATNAAAAFVWSGLSDGLQPEEIVEELLEASPGAEERVLFDQVWDLLVAWAKLGLFTGFEPSAVLRVAKVGLSVESFRDAKHPDALIVVPPGFLPGSRTSLPADCIKRLLLLNPISEGSARWVEGTATAALDALGRNLEGGLRVTAAEARRLVEWVEECEVLEVFVDTESKHEVLAVVDRALRPESDSSVVQSGS